MIDKQAILEYLCLGHTLDDKTFIRGQKYKHKNIQPVTFEDWKPVRLEDAKDILEWYFLQYRNKKCAVFLSGGKDSRLLAEILKKLDIDTTGVTVAYQPDSDENKIAVKVCKKLNINYCYMPINLSMYTIPHMKSTLGYCRDDPSAMPSYNYTFYSGFLNKFDAVFDGSYLTDTKREARFYRNGNIKTTSDTIIKEDHRIDEKYTGSIEQQCTKYINDYFIKYIDCCKDIFNLEIPILNNVVMNTMWSIPEKDTVLKLLKKYYPTTYNIPRSESPFPIGYPWQIHYSYRVFRNTIRDRVKGFNGGKPSYVDSGAWCGYEDIYHRTINEVMHVLRQLIPEFEFLDQRILSMKLNAKNNREHIPTIRRIINVILWGESNHANM